ncbi:sulfotransferase family protein [Gammaproteobacteria bacterium]|nr:sulfotransferase family protein [Gammaproteobacteria bacterium]
MVWGLDSWLGQEYIDNRWYEFQHLSMLELLSFTADEFKHFDSFAVIRNPYSRLVSEYLWRRPTKQRRPEAAMLFFDSFMEYMQKIPQDIDANWPLCLENADQASVAWVCTRYT